MFAPNEGPTRAALRHTLGGLQAGVAGAFVMLACVMAGSLWDRRSIWVVPNLFATTFYGSDAYRNELLRTTWAGVALLVAVYGILGAVWGSIVRDARKRSMRLYGVLFGLTVYVVFYDFLWKHANPLVTLYAPDRQLQIGHLLWGLVLARSPIYSKRIAQATTEYPAEAVQEIASGEVLR